MKINRIISMVLASVLLFGNITVISSASEISTPVQKNFTVTYATPRATGSFNMTIPARSQSRANSSFPMAAGETITIKASYSPFSANVDFGLITPDGTYRYFNITNGSIDKTILIEESGNYIFQIRNNSYYEIEVSGFVNY